jgi:hypothetical protein
MKRFLLGISALLLTTVMGFAQPALKLATYHGSSAPRVERVSRHRHHRQKRYKNNHRRYRQHGNRPHHGV